MTRPIRVLTIWQPWATLIMIGAKPFEFRGNSYLNRNAYSSGPRVGELVVIHAAARRINRSEVRDLIERMKNGTSGLHPEKARPLLERLLSAYKCSGVVEMSAGLGTVIMGEPTMAHKLFPEKFAHINDSDRPQNAKWAWPMLSPIPWIPPVPAKGAQGFWYWRNEVPQ
jgi:hypothetical protein